MLRLPHNVGIGGAVQTGLKFALAGYDTAVRLDGDGQHDAGELGGFSPHSSAVRPTSSSAPLRRPRRLVPAPFARRIGIRVFARLVSLLGGQRVTDTTSGFLALDRIGIELFAAEYPHDYPEVEALVALKSGCGSHRCRSTCASARREPRRSRSCGRSTTSSGPARTARCQPAPLSAPPGCSPVTPLRVSLVGVVASIL